MAAATNIKINLTKETKFGLKTFKFLMIANLQDASLEGLEPACHQIADWIVENAGTSVWMNLPIWHLSEGFRIYPISGDNPLWLLLDGVSKKSPSNWLVFKNNPKSSDEIVVTHFGPLGVIRKEIELGKDEEQNWERLFEDKSRHRGPSADPEEKERSRKALQGHIDAHYAKAKEELFSSIEVQKAVVVDVIKFIHGPTDDAAALAANLTAALAPSALKVGCKVLLKETLLVLSKQLAKEMAIIYGKIAGKGTGKIAFKKIPVVGLAFGVGFGAFRLLQGDLTGAGLELASGAASTIPGAGTAASFAIDGLLACKDLALAIEKLEHYQLVLDRASGALERLADAAVMLEEEHELVTRAFFDPGLGFAFNSQDFVQALT